MKVVNWVLKAVKWLKGIFDLVKWVLAIVVLITSLGWFKSCSNKNKEINNITNILTSKVESFKTESGLNAMQADTWQIKNKSLEKVNGEISHENTQIKNELIEARQTISDAELREKDVQNYIKNELVRKDSIETSIIFIDDPCRFKIEPIEQEFLSLTFNQNENYDILNIDHEYRNTIYTLINLYPSRINNPKRRRNGEKHFPNWALFWGWDHTTVTTVKDPKSEITNIVSIEFNK
jgi:hypothetical protein